MSSGIYTELENAVKGQVVVRFPPEASGFLHIGHAKAALLNYHYKTIYDGKLVMRFDDTNPEKEKEDYEKAILHDVESLGIKWDHFSYSSDHFPKLLEICTQMIKDGNAYVDDTPAEQMKIERETRQPSKSRELSIHENLRRWDEMIKGSEEGQKCCVRAKLDYQSKNGCLRDPTMYRCKNEPHPRTGDKFKVYPTYDFTCPIVDSLEGVTHALRTTEYLDRDPQYFWFLETLGMRKPTIASYSRLNMMNTVLSKRKLTWLVDEKIVDGWDDPRMPTVQGILRRGLTVEGLKQFILAQGSSRAIVFMEWDKIWAFNKKVLDPTVPRYTAIDSKDSVVVTLEDYDGNLVIDVALHPKDEKLGKRQVKVAKNLLIEQTDALQLKEGEPATFLSLGNVRIQKIDKDENGKVLKISAKLDLDNKDFKKTYKLTWLSENNVEKATLIYYDHIITKPIMGKDEDFKDFVNRDTKVEVPVFTDPEASKFKSRTIIQYQRKGNFICDSRLVFNYIPDGTSKNPHSNVVATSGKKPKEAGEKKAKEPKKPKEPKGPKGDEKAKISEESKEPKEVKQNTEAKEPKEAKKPKEPKKPKEAKKPQEPKAKEDGKKQTKLGMSATKEDDFSKWYTEVITKSDMIEYYDVSGCYTLLPWSYEIWEEIQYFLNQKIKALGVRNCYFPMFVSRNALEKEKDHIADFAPEVAWVTKAGQSDMAEPIAIRPTSETIMYPAFAKRVRSHRDLPIRFNQWNNVVRWEFKDPTPFIRTREFLWQEGHTAFQTKEEAEQEVGDILELYAAVYEDLLAIPVVRGRKTEKEKFPGAEFTLTVEGYIAANGRGIQGATSHHLGQKFSKMFDISFQDPDDPSKRQYVYQNSWGLSTRTIGVLIMCHGDNKGLVMPPRVSPVQAVIIPVGITASTTPEAKATLLEASRNLSKELSSAGIKIKLDDSDHYTPGWKFNHYEVQGVPIRIELGPRDLEKQQFVACRRDTGEKINIEIKSAAQNLKDILENMQQSLYSKCKETMDARRVLVTDFKTEFLPKLNEKCTIIAPFCGRPACEDNIKRDSVKDELMGAKSLCIPRDQPETALPTKCVHPECNEPAQFWTLFGRSY